MRFRRSLALATGASIAALLTAAPALAQDAPAAEAAAQDDGGVAEIVVTAQRREERLQDAPLPVTALSADSLAARGIDNLADVSNFAPNLEMHPTNRPAGGGSAFAGYIRGVGTGDFQFPTDPGIGLYVDDVYIARSMGGLLSLEDMQAAGHPERPIADSALIAKFGDCAGYAAAPLARARATAMAEEILAFPLDSPASALPL